MKWSIDGIEPTIKLPIGYQRYNTIIRHYPECLALEKGVVNFWEDTLGYEFTPKSRAVISLLGFYYEDDLKRIKYIGG